MRRPARLVLIAATALIGLAACSGAEPDEGAAVPVGTVLDSTGTAEGRSVFVQLPLGRVDLTISRPRQDLPAYDETYDRAPEGGSLVGVSWAWDNVGAVLSMLDPALPEPEPRFSLLADGEAYPLDEAFLRRLDDDPVGGAGPDVPVLDFSGTAWVGVAGEPGDLQVQVEYDGLTQVVDPAETSVLREAGAATMLYGPATDLAALPVTCPEPEVVGTPAFAVETPSCDVSVARLPYRQGVGWAPEGQPWVVVTHRFGAGSVVTWQQGDQQEVYRVDETGAPVLRLDGAEPVADPPYESAGDVGTTVFAAADRGAVLTADASLPVAAAGGADAPAPDSATLLVRWTLPLP